MKTEIIYCSMTGHSQKIARAVAAEFVIEAKNIKIKPDLQDVDLLFIVGGIYGGKSLPDMLEFVKTLKPDIIKKAVLMTSSTSDKNGQDDVRFILQANGIEVASTEYRCKGNFLFLKFGHPNKQEITDAVEFAKKMIKITDK